MSEGLPTTREEAWEARIECAFLAGRDAGLRRAAEVAKRVFRGDRQAREAMIAAILAECSEGSK